MNSKSSVSTSMNLAPSLSLGVIREKPTTLSIFRGNSPRQIKSLYKIELKDAISKKRQIGLDSKRFSDSRESRHNRNLIFSGSSRKL